MPALTPEMRAAIEKAAREQGMNPAYALAVAERESSFDPAAHSSKTIHGLFQMQKGHRDRYGIGDSEDPYSQSKGWMGFQKDVRKEMASVLGREPTDAEAYTGHHFGGVRAGRMMKMDPDTPVEAVFTRQEMEANPHFAKAGTVGNLNKTILADMDRRMQKYGGEATAASGAAEPAYKPDFSDGASPVGFENAAAVPPPASATGQQIAANAAAPAAAAGPNSFKGIPDLNKQDAPLEHLQTVRPQMPQMAAIGGMPATPTAPPPAQQGAPDPMSIMLGSPPIPPQAAEGREQITEGLMGIAV